MRPLFCVTAALAVVCVGLLVSAELPSRPVVVAAGRDDAAKPEPAPKLSAKAFRLERADAKEALAVLNQLCGPASVELATPGRAAPVQHDALGGGRAGPVVPWETVWLASPIEGTKLLVVRGRDEQLRIAADVVAVLDRPADAPLPKLSAVRPIALKRLTATPVQDAVRGLGYEQVNTWAMNDNLLLLTGPAGDLDQIAAWAAEAERLQPDR